MNEHINFLSQQLRDFNSAKNNEAKEIIIQIVELYFNRNNDLHQIFRQQFTGFMYEEALTTLWFGRDMNRFLVFLRENY